jgi:hypothetical protein
VKGAHGARLGVVTCVDCRRLSRLYPTLET